MVWNKLFKELQRVRTAKDQVWAPGGKTMKHIGNKLPTGKDGKKEYHESQEKMKF